MSAHRDRERSRGQARSRCRDESGNILILFAILLPLFLFMGMIVIDVGYWWANARKAQIAADACALAAARELPQDWNDDPLPGAPLEECWFGDVDGDGDGDTEYVRTNLPDQSAGADARPLHVSTQVLSPYDGRSDQVEVIVEMKVETFFGRFIGFDGISLTRRAVAEQSVGEGDYAIYARASDCGDALRFNGEDANIDGLVHSNGEFTVDGEDFWAAKGTYDGPASVADGNCTPDTEPDALFGSPQASATASEPTDSGFQPWPEWFTPAEFGWTAGCTFSGQKIEIDDTTLKIDGQPTNHGGTLQPGTYCATDLFKIGGNDITGTITALAPKIEVGGNDHNLTSFHASKVLFFAVPNIDASNDGAPPDGTGVVCTHANEMNLINGNDNVWRGRIFHPCGRVIVNGNSSSTIEGAIYAKLVRVNGAGFTMVGKGASGSDITLALEQ